ncbi:MAG: hypothetical protein AVDCRST_MAG22-3637, partial [uncultured Rubrobacteraceae bacterium]
GEGARGGEASRAADRGAPRQGGGGRDRGRPRCPQEAHQAPGGGARLAGDRDRAAGRRRGGMAPRRRRARELAGVRRCREAARRAPPVAARARLDHLRLLRGEGGVGAEGPLARPCRGDPSRARGGVGGGTSLTLAPPRAGRSGEGWSFRGGCL